VSATDASPPIAPTEVGSRDRDEGGLSPLVKVAVVFTLLGGALSLLWFSTSAEDAFVYSKLVHEVQGDPSAVAGRELRVEGDLVPGSILFQESPCEWRFVLGSEGQKMPVRFPQCIVPDTFKDGMGIKVTVQGKITEEGHFLANQVIPRCPSKYEMQQKAANGEKMPHAAPLTIPGA
jgi:cytochrome c-type biogenesis protein CcmE